MTNRKVICIMREIIKESDEEKKYRRIRAYRELPVGERRKTDYEKYISEQQTKR